MAHVKSRAIDVLTGKESVVYFTDQGWADHEQARLDAEAAEAARDHDDEAIEKVERIVKAFLKAYAKREGVTFAQLKNAIKAEL